jgi:P-type Ca2+ transporter type 2C
MIQLVDATSAGRARFRVSELYRSPDVQQYLERSLSQYLDIQTVTANPLTSSVLVYFDKTITVKQIASRIQAIVEQFEQDQGIHHDVAIVEGNAANSATVENWHLMDVEMVVDQLQTSTTNGLSPTKVQENLQQYGANRLPEAETRSDLSILLDQFQSLPVALLGVAAGISAFTGGLADALVISGVVAMNAAIGYFTESQSERIIHSLTQRANRNAIVLRNGDVQTLNAEEIVVGDILMVKPGDYVAADARLFQTDNLSVDEAALTGESIPVNKAIDRLTAQNVPLADRLNMVYKGTLVTGGQGRAVVVETGQRTEMGRIQSLVSDASSMDTPLSQQLDQVGSQLVTLGTAVCGLVFGIGLLRGNPFLPMLKTAISLAVAAVPEGLPTIATTILALGIQDMRQHNVLVRSLSAVEALGSIQTICLDKTGTITENRMSVVELYTAIGEIKVTNGEFFKRDYPIHPSQLTLLQRLIEIGVLCNESRIERNNDDYTVTGSSTENAFIYLGINAEVDVIKLRQDCPLLTTIQRAQNRNVMTTIHEIGGNRRLIAVKGSPAEILMRCDRWLTNGEATPLTDDDREKLDIANDLMAGKALRVLAVAYAERESEEGDPESNLIWLGLVGMQDPIRPGVTNLMKQFHEAGIDTVMITGDQSPTAYAIGKELKLSRTDHLEILDSTDLTQLPPKALEALSDKVNVFARVSPANKLQIVQALQLAGRTVAMTGDGMNDAPALKSANVGVAMGTTGIDVAREVADIVLEDDQLETLIVAVSEGRTIYTNIRKSVHFLLATNLSEIMVEMVAIALGLGEPLNAIQLLWLNLLSDIFPGLALALEAPEPDVLQHPPRRPDEPIIPAGDFGHIALEAGLLSASTLAAYGYGIVRYGIGPKASTIAFMSLTSGQLLHAMTCRTQQHSIFDVGKTALPANPYLVTALVGSFGLQFLATSIPWLRTLLRIEPLDPLDWAVVTSSVVAPFLINEATKLTLPENPQ